MLNSGTPQKVLIPELTLSSLLILRRFALLLCNTTVHLLITPSLSADIPLVPRVELLETYLVNTQCQAVTLFHLSWELNSQVRTRLKARLTKEEENKEM